MNELIHATGGYELALDAGATRKQTELLELGAGITDVTNGDGQTLAVLAMQEIKAWLKKVEAARKTVKEPVLDVGKRIDAIAARHCEPLEFEFQRLSKLVSFFQEDERKRVAEAEAARQAEIRRLAQIEADKIAEENRRIEAQRLAELKLQKDSAKKRELEAAIKAEAEANKAKAEAAAATVAVEAAIRAPLPEAQRESGMVVKKVVKWEITNAAKLYAQFPAWFDLVPRKAVINASVSKDTAIEGLKVWEETQTTVRA